MWQGLLTLPRGGPKVSSPLEVIPGLFRSGRVLVDRHILGYLVADEPWSSKVEPGEHTITILFGRRPVILCRPGSAGCAVSVSLSAVERVDFACRFRPDISRLWVQARRTREIRLAALIAAFYCALGLNWICEPYLRQAVALVVWYLPDHGLLILFRQNG